MTLTKNEAGAAPVACVYSDEAVITDVSSALDLMANVRYETDCDRIAINKEALAEDFFRLRTRLAGDVLQRYVNYRLKLAVYGDFSGYDSAALRDFIRESNEGNHFFFVATLEEAVARLAAAKL